MKYIIHIHIGGKRKQN